MSKLRYKEPKSLRLVIIIVIALVIVFAVFSLLSYNIIPCPQQVRTTIIGATEIKTYQVMTMAKTVKELIMHLGDKYKIPYEISGEQLVMWNNEYNSRSVRWVVIIDGKQVPDKNQLSYSIVNVQEVVIRYKNYMEG